MRATLLLALVTLLPAQGGGDIEGQDPPSPRTIGGTVGQLPLPTDLPPGPDDPARQAIARGLAWLAKDLVTSATGASQTGDPQHASPVGVSALSCLAYMAGGSTPTRGPYQRQLTRQLDYLLSLVTPEGEEDAGYVHATDDAQSRMHGHGLAVLAFTQAYSLSDGSPRGKRLRSAIALGLQRIEQAQGSDGGWYYEPQRWELTEGSITVCLLWALRGARNAGFKVDGQVIARALEYVRSLQEESGGFIYAPQEPRSSVALTGACLSTLHALGTYEGREVDDGYGYIWRELALRETNRDQGLVGKAVPFPYYERWYLAQALWHHRDTKVFRRWSAGEWVQIIREQRPDGSWADARYNGEGARIEGRYGTAYATAMNVLTLSVPEGLLPAYQR
jgi:hypothetical protein